MQPTQKQCPHLSACTHSPTVPTSSRHTGQGSLATLKLQGAVTWPPSDVALSLQHSVPSARPVANAFAGARDALRSAALPGTAGVARSGLDGMKGGVD
eukprot:CAMPEP_0183334226 /NCGR_PEP_ID=MMETSP0164_2-20130417/2889_1 /TAXON_ID=221442 /ORGANISM="Coccolithus pelagicus ssp braarudi, Strain PLY182g" /LENGTH=97 /DNA_ID=CAMNT_0025503325 /DNA_START=652 /DNA_END=945 /DNA_ORIENTATION=+